MHHSIRNLADVVDWRLCVGCGVCAYLCPKDAVQLFDFPSEGIRPVVASDACGTCCDCVRACPAVSTDFSFPPSPTPASESLRPWGPVLEIWEGYASDSEIRFQGSSGGALTAISAYCLEVLGMHGVLHIGQSPTDPVRNSTRLSRTRGELMSAAGSRYSPASVGNGLGLVESAPSPCVVIGKPSEIAGVSNACKVRDPLRKKVGVTLSFFCAETPSTGGTIALLDRFGIRPDSLDSLRFRGKGWPGHFVATRKGEAEPAAKMTYRESWGFLQAHRPWSVQMWPDGTGELADITCGDPWYEKPDGTNPGFSLLLARTQRGVEILRGAREKGYLTLQPAEAWKLEKSQSGLLKKKGAVWGRRLALRLLGLPVTRFIGLDLFRCWRPLPLMEKLRSTFGTLRRIITRKVYLRSRLTKTTEGVRLNRPTV
jgi:coenzyme F420 hydrogenase subunit beta